MKAQDLLTRCKGCDGLTALDDEALSALYTDLKASLPSKRSVRARISLDNLLNPSAVDQFGAGYNKAIEEVHKVLKDYFGESQ